MKKAQASFPKFELAPENALGSWPEISEVFACTGAEFKRRDLDSRGKDSRRQIFFAGSSNDSAISSSMSRIVAMSSPSVGFERGGPRL